MNETYEWLYDHYALPMMQSKKPLKKSREPSLPAVIQTAGYFCGNRSKAHACGGKPTPSLSAYNRACV